MEAIRRWTCAGTAGALRALTALALVGSPLAAKAGDRPAVRGTDRALEYFANTGGRSLDDYVTSLRPPAISAEARARSLAMFRPHVVRPSMPRQAKLDALQPVLEHLERGSITEVTILRLGLAWAGWFDGSVVFVSEETVDLLAVEELQAIVAHELGHEYFSAEYQSALAQRDYDTVREIELKCDAVAILTMTRLGRKPAALQSGMSRLTRFNEGLGHPDGAVLHPTLEERRRFGRAMVLMVELEGQVR